MPELPSPNDVHSHDMPLRDETRSSSLPGLFWAGSILFAANVAVLLGICISPELKVNMYGEVPEGTAASAAVKPSPFTERVQMITAKAPKQATRLRPTAFVEPAVPDSAYAQIDGPAQLDLPKVAPVAASAQQLDVRRATPAALTVYTPDSTIPLRRATQNSVMQTAPLDVAPMRSGQRAPVVVN